METVSIDCAYWIPPVSERFPGQWQWDYLRTVLAPVWERAIEDVARWMQAAKAGGE